MAEKPPLIAHVVNALRMGGLENGLINLINRIPNDRYRHVVICLTDYDDFAQRIERDDVTIFALNKKPGKDPGWYIRMWKLLRELKPDIIHTRNLATVEAQFVAFTAGVKGRVHGEHGWDMVDLGGTNQKYLWLRRALNPFIQRFIPLSVELSDYLSKRVGVRESKITRICNGVDTDQFKPGNGENDRPVELQGEQGVIIGCVGRMEQVKDPLNLVEAFIDIMTNHPELREKARLVMVGHGTLYEAALDRLTEQGWMDRAWLPGHRDDIAELLQLFDVFILPSKAEGISNTILEAMATGLPVVATRVGGNAELLVEGCNASLVDPSSKVALAQAMLEYINNDTMRIAHGRYSRERAESLFSIQSMVDSYMRVYDSVM